MMCGVPVVTRLGSAFASRVGASLLRAAGLPELVTSSLAEYESLALKLAHDPALLLAIKTKLSNGRATAPLFDIARTTRDLERAYGHMLARALSGKAAESFTISPLD